MNEEKEIRLIQNEAFLKKAYHAALLPSMLSILSGCINILADGILIGQKIGAEGLAAVNFCMPVYLMLCIVGSLPVSGAAIRCSQEIGKNHLIKARRFYCSAVTICLFAAAIVTAVGLVMIDRLTAFLCKDAAVLAMVRDYMSVTLAGALPKILLYIPFWFLRLDGKNRTVTAMMSVMAVGNVVLDILFLNVLQTGVFGAGLASVIATALACIYGFAGLQRGSPCFRIGFALPEKAELGRLLMVGSPAAMNNLFQALRILCVNALLAEYGGSLLVAEFSVLNGISAFSEAVTIGVPQACTAMLGIYHGERDNESIRILLGLEVKKGLLGCLVFGICIVAGADLISTTYGMGQPMRLPFLCLAISLVPSLWNNILSVYYNVAGHIRLSNMLIVLRVYVFTVVCLALFLETESTPWLFLLASELFTMMVWIAVTWYVHRRNENRSRFLLMDQTLEREGRTINFSMVSDPKKICDASEQITSFCRENGMHDGQVVRVSLALEEIMTLITAVNEPAQVSFDVRVFAVQGTIGIRIRYDGKDYNPLLSERELSADNELYMGIRMIREMVKKVMYQRTFGKNTLLIQI